MKKTIKKLSLCFSGQKCFAEGISVTLNRNYIKISLDTGDFYLSIPNLAIASMENKDKKISLEKIEYFYEGFSTVKFALSFNKDVYKTFVSREYLLFSIDREDPKLVLLDSVSVEYNNDPPKVTGIKNQKMEISYENSVM